MLLVELIEYLQKQDPMRTINFLLHSPLATSTEDVVFQISGYMNTVGKQVELLQTYADRVVKTSDGELYQIHKYTPVWAMDGRGELIPLYPNMLDGLLDREERKPYDMGSSDSMQLKSNGEEAAMKKG